MASDTSQAFLERLREWHGLGWSVEEIAARIITAESETAVFWVRALVAIALESPRLRSPEQNAGEGHFSSGGGGSERA
jgi:hypothetical protein